MRRRISTAIIVVLLGCYSQVMSQGSVDLAAIHRIQEAGFQHSQVMETLIGLCDMQGPRLSGTPAYRQAAERSQVLLKSWGVDEAQLERYTSAFAGWELENFSAAVVEPYYLTLTAQPAAWTGSTDGTVKGTPLLVDLYDLEALEARAGQLAGRILLHREAEPRCAPEALVYNRPILKEAAAQLNPFGRTGLGDHRDWDLKAIMEEDFDRFGKSEEDALMDFLIAQNVAAVLMPSVMDNGLLRVSEANFGACQDGEAVPFIFISKENHGRLLRMMERGLKPVVALNQKTRFFRNPDNHVNVIAQIDGTDPRLKHEVVLIGAHLDAWHGGTGASDNGAGCAVMMEVMRIFKQLNLKPRRTVRIGLWGGEEQMFNGSLGYAKAHLTDVLSGEPGPSPEKIIAYFNHDSGAGRIRGVFLQGNEACRPFFEAALKPFHRMGVETVSIRNSFGTDHVVFDALNIPAFEFIQDPGLYESHQYHANMDVVDLIEEDALKLNAVFIASLVYKAAMQDAPLPRKLIVK